MGRSSIPGRARTLRRALLAVAVVVLGGFVMAIGWLAAAPLTTPPTAPAPTAAPAAAPRATTPPTAAPTPTPAPTQAPAGRMWSVVVTFYGAADNDPGADFVRYFYLAPQDGQPEDTFNPVHPASEARR